MHPSIFQITVKRFAPVLGLFVLIYGAPMDSRALIVDHTSARLDLIPPAYIDLIQQNVRIYYASESHGTQLLTGMERIANQDSRFRVAINWSLPQQSDALCIEYQTQTPAAFFSSVQSYLNANRSINVVMFAWCGEASYYDVNQYTSQMEGLEAANPGVIFVYFTGHAQENDCPGCNRHRFNEAVRAYCGSKDKVLFDFADMDVWYGNEMHTYICPGWCACAGEAIPLQHPQYAQEQAGHTTYESCERKGSAVWWMLANIFDWGNATPVELSSFSAVRGDSGVLLQWRTTSETANLGFGIERSTDKITFQEIAFIQGGGTVAHVQNYSYLDKSAGCAESYFYRLRQVDQNGQIRFFGIIEVNSQPPQGFYLYPNYPNPFRTETAISFDLPDASWVDLAVYDLRGQLVRVLQAGRMSAGRTITRWDRRDASGRMVANGFYLLQLSVGHHRAVRRLLLF